jgi:hypothetical protein
VPPSARIAAAVAAQKAARAQRVAFYTESRSLGFPPAAAAADAGISDPQRIAAYEREYQANAKRDQRERQDAERDELGKAS